MGIFESLKPLGPAPLPPGDMRAANAMKRRFSAALACLVGILVNASADSATRRWSGVAILAAAIVVFCVLEYRTYRESVQER